MGRGPDAQIQQVIICSDSSSALTSLQYFRSQSRQDIVNKIFEILYRLSRINICVKFMWIPAHRGIKGNEHADHLAKQALTLLEVMDISLSKMEAKSLVKRNILAEWQEQWNTSNTGRHLHALQNTVGTVRTCRGSAKEEGIITRLRLGHTGLNITLHLINKHPTGLCDNCTEIESVEHVLLHCPKYNRQRLIDEVRVQSQEEISLKHVFSFVKQKTLICFLKESGVYRRI